VDDVLPELRQWSDGKGITIDGYAFTIGRFDHAIGYAHLFWPAFHEHDGCVFRRPVNIGHYEEWLSHFAGDRSRVEAMMNHEDLAYLFLSDGYEPTASVIAHLANVMRDMWAAKLKLEYPGRDFQVVTSCLDRVVDAQLTFFEQRVSDRHEC
jgi:hypothetical protein